jgi:hypothetical protein
MNLKVINRGKRNMKIILVKKLQKKLCWMAKWITIVYVLVVCVYIVWGYYGECCMVKQRNCPRVHWCGAGCDAVSFSSILAENASSVLRVTESTLNVDATGYSEALPFNFQRASKPQDCDLNTAMKASHFTIKLTSNLPCVRSYAERLFRLLLVQFNFADGF